MLEIEREAALVPGSQLPIVVRDLPRYWRQGTPGITHARGLDLDHVGAEVGQDRGGGRPGDPASAVDDVQASKEALSHGRVSSLILPTVCMEKTQADGGFRGRTHGIHHAPRADTRMRGDCSQRPGAVGESLRRTAGYTGLHR